MTPQAQEFFLIFTPEEEDTSMFINRYLLDLYIEQVRRTSPLLSLSVQRENDTGRCRIAHVITFVFISFSAANDVALPALKT